MIVKKERMVLQSKFSRISLLIIQLILFSQSNRTFELSQKYFLAQVIDPQFYLENNATLLANNQQQDQNDMMLYYDADNQIIYRFIPLEHLANLQSTNYLYRSSN